MSTENLPAIASPALMPATFSEGMKFAEMMATSELIPQHLRGKPADCMLVIMQAVRWNADPFAVAQEFSSIKGKPMYGGKLVAAVVNARGNLLRRLSYEYSGEGNTRKVVVSGHLKGETQPRTIEVKFVDARTDNSMWKSQPDQQLAYSGARIWARRHTPELMIGIYSPEEFDHADQPPHSGREPQQLVASQAPSIVPQVQHHRSVENVLDGLAREPERVPAEVKDPVADPKTGEVVWTDKPAEEMPETLPEKGADPEVSYALKALFDQPQPGNRDEYLAWVEGRWEYAKTPAEQEALRLYWTLTVGQRSLFGVTLADGRELAAKMRRLQPA